MDEMNVDDVAELIGEQNLGKVELVSRAGEEAVEVVEQKVFEKVMKTKGIMSYSEDISESKLNEFL